MRVSDYLAVYSMYDDATDTWGDVVVLSLEAGTSLSFGQSSDGNLNYYYVRNSDGELIEGVVQRYARRGAGIVKSDANTDTFGNGTILGRGSLSGVLASSNANQYLDLVSVYYTRDNNLVNIKGCFRLRSNAGTGTQNGNLRITPPASLAIGAGTNTALSPGWVWRIGGSITSDNEYVKFDSANARLITNGTLDSIEAGLMYELDVTYTMAATW